MKPLWKEHRPRPALSEQSLQCVFAAERGCGELGSPLGVVGPEPQILVLALERRSDRDEIVLLYRLHGKMLPLQQVDEAVPDPFGPLQPFQRIREAGGLHGEREREC